MSKEEKKVNRRDFLFTASYTVGAVGLGAVVWPLIHQMNPDKAQQASLSLKPLNTQLAKHYTLHLMPRTLHLSPP